MSVTVVDEERTDTLRVRLPKPLYRWVKEQAARERRSLTQQTVILLERAKDCEKEKTGR